MAWILRLVKIGTEGENQSADVVRINRPDDLGDIATLGLTLVEGKLLLAGLQQEIVAAQARGHAARRLRPIGLHAVRPGHGAASSILLCWLCWIRSWPWLGIALPLQLDRIQVHLAALMTYRVADALVQMFPVSAGTDAETVAVTP